MHSKACTSLRSFLLLLEEQKELVRIKVPVNPYLEIAEIHRRVVQSGGPALLFENVTGSTYRVVTNLFGSPKRVHLGLGNSIHQLIDQAIELAHGPSLESNRSSKSSFLASLWQKRELIKGLLKVGTRKANANELLSSQNLSLNDLPFLTSWPYDGGPFLTLPLVYTSDPSNKHLSNFGMYRIQRFSSERAGLHFQIGKGAGFHFHRAEQLNQNLPISIFLGGSPALIASAIAPLPENVNEWLLASAMQGEKLKVLNKKNWPHPIPCDVEFAILGEAICGKRALEGPFGDHYGYYSLAHEFPYMQISQILAKSDAIYPATIVGRPPQEDLYLGDWLQELLSPLIRLVMPGVVKLWSYGQTGFHALAAALVKQRYEREALSHALRILGEGQLAFTKFLLITDQPCDLKNFKQVLEIVLERFIPQTDLFILSQLSLDTLDYTGPKLNHGSRGILMGTGNLCRKLLDSFNTPLPTPFTKAAVFCAGCLVVQGPSYSTYPQLAKELLHQNLQVWPLIIVVDDLQETLRSENDFLWTVFMRFEPARDIHTIASLSHHHLMHELPIVIDARMKPFYPPVVEADDQTAQLVSKRWNSYFS